MQEEKEQNAKYQTSGNDLLRSLPLASICYSPCTLNNSEILNTYQERLHLAYTTLQAVPLIVNAVGEEFVPLQEAWKPGSTASELPAAIELFTETFVTVTALPDCEKLPFQPNVTICPLAKEKRSVQPLIAVVPVFVIVKPAWKPPDHWLTTL